MGTKFGLCHPQGWIRSIQPRGCTATCVFKYRDHAKVGSIIQRGKSLRRHQSTAPFDLHASTLNTMISSTLERSGPQVADRKASITSTPTWYHAIIAAQDGDLERTKDGKYKGHVRGQMVEMSEVESQPVFQFIHETLPQDQDVQKELDAHVAMLEELTQYVGAFVEALREANILRSLLTESRDLLLSFLRKNPGFAHDTTNKPTPASAQIPSDRSKKSRETRATSHTRPQTPAAEANNYAARDSERKRSPTPISTQSKRISASEQETRYRYSFMHSQIENGATWDQMPALYKEEFGIWRTAGSLRTVYNQHRAWSKIPTKTCAPCQPPPQTPTEEADNHEVRGSGRKRPPTPTSTRLNRINATEQEKLHRNDFLLSQRREGMDWNQLCSAYKEKFGIWRSANALMGYHKLALKSQDVTTSPRSSPVHDNTDTRSKKRKRSPSPIPATYMEIPPSEDELLHRWSFLKSHRQAGLSWNETARLYHEDFGISRPCKSLINCYNYNKQREQMDSSVQETSCAQMPGSDNQNDQRVVRRYSSNHLAEGSSDKSVDSKTLCSRRRSLSIDCSSESYFSEVTPP